MAEAASATPTIAETFNHGAAGYDAMRRRLLPDFDAFFGAALDLIDDWTRTVRRSSSPLRVLDLGAGTGLFTSLFLDRHGDAEVTLNDIADAMMAEARARFAGNGAITFLAGDMTEIALGGPYDLVLSSLAIHHLEHPVKQALFSRIRDVLVPGGLFVNAEQVLGPTPEAEDRYARHWLKTVRALGVPEDEIDKVQARMLHDRCATVADQLAWMGAAGLVEVDCVFKSWRFAVLSGRAPEA